MTHDKDHVPAAPAPKSPETLPGPNREAEITRVGEALAPGTVPDEERQERERRGQRGNTPGLGKP